MKSKFIFSILCLLPLVLLPTIAAAQGLPEHIRGLHGILTDLMNKMMPRCATLIRSAQLIASFATTFYIGHRVWKHIAQAEPIDFYPLFRPFVLGFCIAFFPGVIKTIDVILEPTVAGTQDMMDQSTTTLKHLIAERQKKIEGSPFYLMYGVNDGDGDRDAWMRYAHKDEIGNEGLFGSLSNSVQFAMAKSYYNLKTWFKELISFLLQLLYEAAALCINTIRTFNLIICAMLGPFVFALAVFDGFQHSLTVWLARYINYYLWLPVANILGAILGMIQEEMVKLDINQINTYGDSFFTTSDIGYLVFMLIGIVSYTTVPSIAAMIVNPGGGGGALTSKITSMTSSYSTAAVATIGGATFLGASGAGMAADAFGNSHLMNTKGYSGQAASGYFHDKLKE